MVKLHTLVDPIGTVHGNRLGSGVLLVPAGDGLPIHVKVNEDVARIRTGYDFHLSIGSGDPSDDDDVIEVIEAIILGNGEEYFTLDPRSERGHPGERLWYPHGERSSVETRYKTVAVKRLRPW